MPIKSFRSVRIQNFDGHLLYHLNCETPARRMPLTKLPHTANRSTSTRTRHFSSQIHGLEAGLSRTKLALKYHFAALRLEFSHVHPICQQQASIHTPNGTLRSDVFSKVMSTNMPNIPTTVHPAYTRVQPPQLLTHEQPYVILFPTWSIHYPHSHDTTKDELAVLCINRINTHDVLPKPLLNSPHHPLFTDF